MIALHRICEQCGAPLEGGNPRKRYCDSTCRSQAHRGGGAIVTPLRTADVTGAADELGPTAAAVAAQLTAADRLGTPDGAAALVLARRLDSPGRDTGSAMAALAREMAARIESALKGVQALGDPTDELKAKRDQKLWAGG